MEKLARLLSDPTDPPNVAYAVLWLAAEGQAASIIRSATWAFILQCLAPMDGGQENGRLAASTVALLRVAAASPPAYAARLLAPESALVVLLSRRSPVPVLLQTLRWLLRSGNSCYRLGPNYSIACPTMKYEGRPDFDAVCARFLATASPGSSSGSGSGSGSGSEPLPPLVPSEPEAEIDGDVEELGDDEDDNDEEAEEERRGNYMRDGLDRFAPEEGDPYLAALAGFRASAPQAKVDVASFSPRTRAVFEDADLCVLEGTSVWVDSARLSLPPASKRSLVWLLGALDALVPGLRWFYHVADGVLLVRNDTADPVVLRDAGGFFRLGVPKKPPFPVVAPGAILALQPFYAEDTEQFLVLDEEARQSAAAVRVTVSTPGALAVPATAAAYDMGGLVAALKRAFPALEWALTPAGDTLRVRAKRSPCVDLRPTTSCDRALGLLVPTRVHKGRWTALVAVMPDYDPGPGAV